MTVEAYKLTEKDRQELNALEGDIQVIENDLAKAEEVGIDVSKPKGEIQKLRKIRDGLLNKF